MTAIGYLIGQIVGLLWRAADLTRLSKLPASALTWLIATPFFGAFLWVLGSSPTWPEDIREKIGMEDAEALGLSTILLTALATFALAFALSRVVASPVRYASHTTNASTAAALWRDMRMVFFQYSSDPVVFYDPFSLWRAPPWMRDPPAEDMSD